MAWHGNGIMGLALYSLSILRGFTFFTLPFLRFDCIHVCFKHFFFFFFLYAVASFVGWLESVRMFWCAVTRLSCLKLMLNSFSLLKGALLP